jgi:hypothetical protein
MDLLCLIKNCSGNATFGHITIVAAAIVGGKPGFGYIVRFATVHQLL